MLDHDHHHDEEMRRCIDLCQECHSECLRAAARYGLGQGGGFAEPEHLGVLLDCAEICGTASDFMLRGSQLHGYVCGLCAHICKVCADRCALIDDPAVRDCTDLCARCAEECLRMSKIAAHETTV